MVNGCRSLMRRQRRERDHLRATPGGLPAELGAHELLDVLATLPERQRAALVLRFYADLPGNEIATIPGLPGGHREVPHLTVASRGCGEVVGE